MSAESAVSRGPGKGLSTRAIDSRGGALPSLQGPWGGDGIALTIASYDASIELDCAAGSIDQVFAADASGRFDLQGSVWFTPPVLLDGWQPQKRPARYVGVLNGKSITLTVTTLDDGAMLTFRLLQNGLSGIRRCL